jgi:hypothetical protein
VWCKSRPLKVGPLIAITWRFEIPNLVWLSIEIRFVGIKTE